jgi:hypothetical protein
VAYGYDLPPQPAITQRCVDPLLPKTLYRSCPATVQPQRATRSISK